MAYIFSALVLCKPLVFFNGGWSDGINRREGLNNAASCGCQCGCKDGTNRREGFTRPAMLAKGGHGDGINLFSTRVMQTISVFQRRV